VFKMEQGTREPSWSTLQALCKALGVEGTAFNKTPTERQPASPAGPVHRQPRRATRLPSSAKLANVTAGKAKAAKSKRAEKGDIV
jgi:transcriptional regulator with XRE-family HTH domain